MATWYGYFSGRPNHRIRLDISLNRQEISNNRSMVNWAAYIERIDAYGTWRADVDSTGNVWVNGVRVGVPTFSYDTRGASRITLGADVLWVPHNSDGTRTFTVSMDVSAAGPLGSAGISAKSFTLPTIPRATDPTIPSPLTAGTAATISLPRASSSFTHDVTYTFGAQSGTIATGAGVTAAWTPQLALLTEIPDAQSGTGEITVVTKSGSTVIGTKKRAFTLQAPSTVVPTISAINVSDANPDVASLIGAYVQGESLLQAAVVAAGAYGSTIKSRKVTVDGTTVDSGQSVSLPTSGSRVVAAAVTDSRGRTGTATGTVSVLPYEPPQVRDFSVARATSAGVPNVNGSHLLMTLDALVSSLVVGTQKNAMTVRVFTRPRGTGAWTARNVITPGLAYNSSVLISGGGIFNVTASWDVRVEVHDKLRHGEDFFAVPTAGAIVDATPDKQAFGKMVEASGPTSQIQGPVRVYGGLDVDGRVVLDADDVATLAETKAGLDGTKLITAKTLKEAVDLPAPMIGNGHSSVAIGGTGWADIPGSLRFELPAYDRPLMCEVKFGALGVTSAGYWMVGASITGSNDPWSIAPEYPDVATAGAQSAIYGMYTPFSQATQQVQLFGSKRFVIPAGVAAVLQMVARKSTTSATAAMNYSAMEWSPIRWL